MYKRVIYIIILVSLSIFAYSQDTINYKNIDELSYEKYLKGDWNKLIKTCELGLENNIDYYYLRMRIGIAYYEKKNYVKAYKHFEKAITFNATDTLLQEYLYYSYLFSGMSYKAKEYGRTLSFEQQMKFNKAPSPKITSLFMEGGIVQNVDYEKLLETDIRSMYLVNDQILIKNSSYFNAGITHPFSEKATMIHSLTYLNIQNLQRTVHGDIFEERTDHEVNQIQYYIGLNNTLKDNYNYDIALHVANINSEYTRIGMVFDSLYSPEPVFREENYSSTEFVLFLGINKRINRSNFNLFGSYSNFNFEKQKQIGLAYTYYPFGNTNFYTRTKVVECFNTTTNTVFDQAIAFKLSKLKFEASITLGKQQNYNENNAYLIYNGADNITRKINLLLSYSICKKVNLSFRFNKYFYNAYTDQFMNPGYVIPDFYDYISQSYIFSLNYKF